jgi:hypothetical protein
MRSKVISVVVILSLIFLSIQFDYVLAKKKEYEYTNYTIPLKGHKFKMIYGEEGGEIRLDINSEVPFSLYISLEENIDSLKDYINENSDTFIYLRKIDNVTDRDVTISCKESGNYILFFENNGDHKDPDLYRSASVNMTITSDYPDPSFLSNINYTLIIILFIPLLVLIPIAAWIRKRA